MAIPIDAAAWHVGQMALYRRLEALAKEDGKDAGLIDEMRFKADMHAQAAEALAAPSDAEPPTVGMDVLNGVTVAGARAFWALKDPARVRAVSELLGHEPRMTERHYNQASGISAGRKLADALARQIPTGARRT